MPKKKDHVEEGYMPFKDYFKKKKKMIIEEFKKGGAGKAKSRGRNKTQYQDKDVPPGDNKAQ